MSMVTNTFHRLGFVQSSTKIVHATDTPRPRYYTSETPILTNCGAKLLVHWRFQLLPRKLVKACSLCKVDLDYVYPEEAFQYDPIGFPLQSDLGFKDPKSQQYC